MIRPALLVLLILGPCFARAQCHFPAGGKTRTVTYRFQPEITADGLVLHVRMEFRASITGIDTLKLPLAWAGEQLHALTDLRVNSVGARIDDERAADTKILHAPANRPVVLTYDLKKDWTGPLVNPLQFHPVLLPEYLEFTGSNALVRLKLPGEAHQTTNFDWRKLPAGWTLATSFGIGLSEEERCQTYTGPWADVDQGLYAAGDYRIHTFQIGRRPAVLAVRGTWKFTDEEAFAQIQRAVGMVRDFWHDDNFPYFLVTLKPYDRDHGSSDGSAFTNAFWMYVSRLDSLTGLLPQLAHESFHAWDPKRMGVMPTDSESVKWFREGPTEYYAQLLSYRAGLLPASKYIDSINNDLRKFPISTSEYVRGRVISLWLDATIRNESDGKRSLDDVMFDMVRESSQPYTLARILETAGRYLSPESRAVLQAAVNDHADLPAPGRMPYLEDCARLSLKDLPTFDLGLDLAQSRKTHLIAGLIEDGPAFKAGLRNGQPLLDVSVHEDDSERTAKFKIRIGTEDKQIAFYPRGKTSPAWRYSLDTTRNCATQ